MTVEIGFVLLVTAAAMAFFALSRFPPDLIAFGVLLTLFFGRAITVEQALRGFSNQAVVAIGAIFVISAALISTGVASVIGGWIGRLSGQSEVRLIGLTMASVAVLSAFMNSVGAAAVLLPAVVVAARAMDTPVSRVLMPLAFGSLLGAMLTLVGTPSNILTSTVLQQSGYAGFGIFEFTPFGLIALLLGIGIVLIGRRHFLPIRPGIKQTKRASHDDAYRLDERLFEAVVPKGSELVRKTLRDIRLGERFGVAVLAVERDGKTVVSPQPDHVILVGDYVVLSARQDDIQRLCRVYGLDVQDRVRLGANALRTEGVSMAELVLMPRSDLIGRTLTEVDFRETYGVSVLGIWRDGHPLRTRLGQIQIQSGDALLVQGSQASLDKLRESTDFVVLTEETTVPTRQNRAPLAIAILLGFVVALVLQLAPVAIVGIAAAVAMVATGCVTMDEARRAIQWRAILLISAMLSLAEAMVGTGTVSFLADWATGSLGTLGVLPVLASVLVLTFFFTHVMGNHVTAVLMAPLAIDAAVRMGSDPRMFALGVALAATSGFSSPYAHPGNLLVMGPGNYRFGDFFRLGIVVGLLTLTASFTMLVLIYGR